MRRALLLVFVCAAALVAAPSARAESHDPQTITLGWMTENADAVVVGVAAEDRRDGDAGPWELTFKVESPIRGALAANDVATVVVSDHGEGRPYVVGRRHLAFLRALPKKDGERTRFEPLSGAFAVRELPADGVEARFPDVCREIASFLDEKGAVEDAGGYRAALVRGIDEADAGLAWTAATDLVRHDEMHAALTADERRRIVAAFERRATGDESKKALALAVAATRDPSAAPALVQSLLLPKAWTIRVEVGEALRRLDDPAVAALLVAALENAEHRVDVLNALGAVAPASSAAATAVAARLGDPTPAVRVEAAHALGLVARAMHRADPPQPLVGRVELLKLVASAATSNEQLAATWSLAQFDEPEAYEALRRLAADDPRELVRKSAERWLANPRLSLILR